ncbi:MAG: aldolase catalytic domain-containing protein [Lachnospiraceae bacterium]|nr:aldolase catalytic domain-containing protein [Lachnospiraceae bacterium]
MNNIRILDCTLRDGGYINNWCFGNRVIRKILMYLSMARIDLVECGFLWDTQYDVDRTVFNNMSQIKVLLPENKQKCVAMIALGEKEISYEKIPECDETIIWGIRITFHKHEIGRAFTYANNLMQKGYKIFMQPVGTCTYSDMELLELVNRVNELKPYAFYIVDTLGTITGTELLRIFQIIDNNLDNKICIGFHAHNNLQLAFANAQELVQTFTHRQIIIDASVKGMGRGAGNLCTELIAQYLNNNLYTSYNVTALLEIIDKYLNRIQEQHSWGYTTPYYLSAIHKCHPNYATFLMNKQTLNVKDMEKIIAEIPSKKKGLYDKEYINLLYNKYQENSIDDKDTIIQLEEKMKSKEVLVLAPGKSLEYEKNKINSYININKPYIISINFSSDMYPENMIFISNSKRFEDFDISAASNKNKDIVVTSNINIGKCERIYKVNYSSYTNDDSIVSDNAGLMLCKLLMKCNVKKIALAGFDGFISDFEKNYFSKDLSNKVDYSLLEIKNERMRIQFKKMRRDMNFIFVTESEYEKETSNYEKI